MEDATRPPKVTKELLRRGCIESQINWVLGESLLKPMEEVEMSL